MGEEPQTAPLLSENDGVTAATREPESQNDILVNYRYRYYTLTSCRYTNAIRVMLFADAVIAIALWASGGNAEYFVDNIIWFHMKQSTFDLALITVFKCLLLFILYSKLEDITLEQLRTPYDNDVFKKKRILHLLIILFSLIFFAYPVIKGGLILNSILNDPNYKKMVLTYNVLAICAIVFSFLELSMALISFWAMKKLKLQRIMHRLNDAHEEVAEDGKPIRRNVNIFRLVKLIKPELGILSLSILCLLGATASQTTAPLFFGMVVDAAQKSMEKLNHTVLILLLIYVGGAIAGMLRATLFTLAGQRMVARLRKHLFSSIIQQDVAFFDTNRTGELTNRLASDTQVLQSAVTVNISMLARYLLQIIGSLVFMFVLNASLTGVLLAVVPIISLGAVQYGKFVRKIRQRFQDRLADASATAEESISNIRTVRSFVGETKAVASYSESVDQSYREGKKLALAEGSFTGIIGIVVAAAISLVLWYGGKLVFEKHITAGVLTSFLLYTLNVAFAFGLLSSVYGDFMQAVGASVRIFELLDKKPAVSNQGGLKLDNLQGGLEFDEVQFTYPSRPENKVLKGVSFHVKSGQMVALVGPSGGGKSTIVNLIERFYDPDSGHVKLGSIFLNQLDPSWFRKQMSIVSQEPTLFACSIRDNISYGKEADLDEIQEAAKQANAHDFIMTFEDKYDTLVGERGVRLSGGQKQRIAIARALLMNPDILLLDEATSALDAESEHLVQDAIDRAMSNRTVLVIAHRLSTVRNASKVIVISKGQIAEEGTHDELIARNGVYKRLVLRQLTAGETNMKDENLEQSVE